MKNWLYQILLKWHKEKVLFEIEQDLRYFQAFNQKWIDYDESPARKRLKELNDKGEKTDLTEAETNEFSELKKEIAHSMGIKNEYEKSLSLRDDLKKYISII